MDATTALARFGAPGEAEQIRVEILAEMARPEFAHWDGQALVAKASRTPSGAAIVNLAGCSSLPWLRTTLARLIAMRLELAEQPNASPKAKQREAAMVAMARGGMRGT